jgi:hypothetical protein
MMLRVRDGSLWFLHWESGDKLMRVRSKVLARLGLHPVEAYGASDWFRSRVANEG